MLLKPLLHPKEVAHVLPVQSVDAPHREPVLRIKAIEVVAIRVRTTATRVKELPEPEATKAKVVVIRDRTPIQVTKAKVAVIRVRGEAIRDKLRELADIRDRIPIPITKVRLPALVDTRAVLPTIKADLLEVHLVHDLVGSDPKVVPEDSVPRLVSDPAVADPVPLPAPRKWIL